MAAVLGVGLGLTVPAAAQPLTEPADLGGSPPAASDPPGEAQTSDQPAQQGPAPSIATSLPSFLADPGGIRSSLEAAGITYSLTYIGEGLGNPTGGVRRGSVYQGRLDGQFDIDMEKFAGLKGLTFHTNFYQIHGRGLSGCCVGNLLVVSGIEALGTTRLYELWAEQKFLDDRVALRVGQLAADTEFLVSQYAGLFVNSTFGWPGITAANLPSGGPAYPLATPAVRVKVTPTPNTSVMAAVFNGDPAPRSGPIGSDDPQRRNRSGTIFPVNDPALVIAEAAYAYGGLKDAPVLPGTVKVGGWYHLARFNDDRFDTDGVSLADPASSGLARRLRGNSGIYAVVDQLLLHTPDTEDGGLGTFLRVSGSPADRNLVSFYLDGGFTFKGLIPGRPDDTIGIGAGYAQISGSFSALDRDARGFRSIAGLDPDSGVLAGPLPPVRSSEAVIEATYQAVVVPGFTVQPDFQYVIRPSGGIANPRDPNGATVRNAAVFGLRATIRY